MLDQSLWGKGPHAAPKLADNIQQVDDFTLHDQSNHANKLHMGEDIPRIVSDIVKNGASLAIVSRNTSKVLCDRVLYYFRAEDPKDGETKAIIKMVRYDEVADEPKTEHFKRIHHWSKYPYSDMLYFSGDRSHCVQEELGVTVEDCPAQTGLTWKIYAEGLEHWHKLTGGSWQTEDESDSMKLCITHFNDVYQVSDQTIDVDGKKEIINVSKFATLLETIQAKWKDRDDGSKDGLTIFSGDLFSPSVESSTTRGRHMPPIINGLKVDVGCVGNHEFDFGFPQLKKLVADTHFPWLLSNIIDDQTGKVPETMAELHILERAGVRIGFIGLVEREWIATITGWPENFKWQDMAETGKRLSARLRDPAGEYRCDFIIALTHSRIPNDIRLARAIGAISPAGQMNRNITEEHGVDLLLGGHDHVYWVSKGVTEWEGYDLQSPQSDAGDDHGDVLVVKSGTDFQDLSELSLTLKDTPAGSVRRKVIQTITGKRWVTREETLVNQAIKTIVDNELKTILAANEEPIFVTEVELETETSYIRRNESPIGNWIADTLRPAYDEALVKLGYEKVDGVIACTGDFRGGRLYHAGNITLGNLMTILPYLDPTIVVELNANELWDALESGLSAYPKQEGRFPAVSGLRVKWDSSKAPNQRVLEVWLTKESERELGPNERPINVDKEQVLRTSTRKYLIMCGEYMAKGGDGYDVLMGKKQVITGENGQSKSALIRKCLLGAQFLTQQLQERRDARATNLSTKTLAALGGAENKFQELRQSMHVPVLSDLPGFQSRMSLPTELSGRFGMPKLPKMPRAPKAVSTESFNTPSLTASNLSPYEELHDYVQVGVDEAKDTGTQVIASGARALRWLSSQTLLSAAISVAEQEDMGMLDPYERQRVRMTISLLRSSPISIDVNLRMNMPVLTSFKALGAASVDANTQAAADEGEIKVKTAEAAAKKTLPVIHPLVDGRLEDMARAQE